MAVARKFSISTADQGCRLDDFLATRASLSPEDASTLIRGGGVYLGRRRAIDPGERLTAGTKVAVYAAPAERRDALDARAPSSLTIVYQDEDVVVVDKPSGVPSQATRASRAGAFDEQVRARVPTARLVHRLDRETSGLVLFSCSDAAHRTFGAWLQARAIERRYRAVVWGHLREEAGTYDLPIGSDPRDRRRRLAGLGAPACSRFAVIARGTTRSGAAITLVELELVTGRTHQLRVHLSHAGHPVCGDPIYGGETGAGAREVADGGHSGERPTAPGRGGARETKRPDGEGVTSAAPPVDRLWLHAWRLAWPGGEAEAPPPPDFDRLFASPKPR